MSDLLLLFLFSVTVKFLELTYTLLYSDAILLINVKINLLSAITYFAETQCLVYFLYLWLFMWFCIVSMWQIAFFTKSLMLYNFVTGCHLISCHLVVFSMLFNIQTLTQEFTTRRPWKIPHTVAHSRFTIYTHYIHGCSKIG